MKSYSGELNAICQKIGKFQSINLVIIVILSFQLVAARDHDEHSHDFDGVCFYLFVKAIFISIDIKQFNREVTNIVLI